MQKNIEQCCAIKFCVRLKKTKQEAYGLLKEAYGDEHMSQASFYWWFNRFSETNEQVKTQTWSTKKCMQGGKHSGSAKVSDARPSNVCEEDI